MAGRFFWLSLEDLFKDDDTEGTASAIRRSGQNLPAAVFRRLGDF